MEILNKQDGIAKLNELGHKKVPFVFIISYDINKIIAEPISEIDPNTLKYHFGNASNFIKRNEKLDKKIIFDSQPIDFDEYLLKFQEVQKYLQKGDSYLLNLTCQTPIRSNLSLSEIFYFTESNFKLEFVDKFVSFSPELFVRIEDNTISSFPMKGTIDANVKNAEDQLIADQKELAEHYTIVDLIRNDLSLVAKNVRVDKFRYIDQIKTNNKTILQSSSHIVGKLEENWQKNIGSIFEKLLPAGSITGAPKRKTIEIIDSIENYSRNYYTGIAGIFDGNNLECYVLIRFIEKQNTKLIYKSGGGITTKSNPQTEYQELIDKVYAPIF